MSLGEPTSGLNAAVIIAEYHPEAAPSTVGSIRALAAVEDVAIGATIHLWRFVQVGLGRGASTSGLSARATRPATDPGRWRGSRGGEVLPGVGAVLPTIGAENILGRDLPCSPSPLSARQPASPCLCAGPTAPRQSPFLCWPARRAPAPAPPCDGPGAPCVEGKCLIVNAPSGGYFGLRLTTARQHNY